MKTITSETVSECIRTHKQEFLEKYGVCKIGLFGSVARNEQTATSDIDIVIEMLPEMKTLHNFLEFKRALERNLGRNVDLGMETAIKPAARKSILEDIIYV
jgi:hypothetical protein